MSLLNRRVRVGLAAAGTVVALTLSSTVAYADPTSVDDAKAELQRLEQEASEIDAQYTAIHVQVEASTAAMETARKDAQAQSAKVQALRAQVGQMALQQFQAKGLDTTTALLTSEDAKAFLSQLSTVERVNANANSLLQDFQTEQANLADIQRTADAQLAAVTADQKKLSQLQTQSDAKVAAAQSLLDRLTEEQRKKLAEQAAAEAARAAAQAQAQAQANSRSAASSRPAAADPVQAAPVVAVSGSASARARAAVSFAMAQVGKSYVLGASGPNAYDCSGLTSAAYASAGVSLPRTSQSQYSVGQRVGLNELQPGDLVFYYSGISHVGMYIGGGQIVHAANPRSGVNVTSVTSMPFMGGRRVA